MRPISLLTLIILVLVICFSSCQKKTEQSAQTDIIKLFNGKNLDGWYTFLKDKGINNDPEGIFSIQDGNLRILGKGNGYIATKNEYENFKLTVEFRYGDLKFVPEDKKQNSGILYFFPADSTDKTWPYAVECQLMTGSVGDYVLMGPSMVINGVKGNADNRVFPKTEDAENPVGEWNTVQVITDGASSTHIVNGTIVNQGTDCSVSKGRILIQSEGAELFVRKVELEPF